MFLLLVAVSAGTWLGTVTAHCTSPTHGPVDWFVMLKLPNGCQYLYADSTDTELRMAEDKLTDESNPLARTMEGIYEGSSNYFMYNDEVPDGPTTNTRGHTKGIVIVDDDSTTWVIHSAPNFPPQSTKGYSYPDSATTYGQSFLCLSLEKASLADVVEQLFYTWPLIYDQKMDETLIEDTPLLDLVLKGKHVKEEPWQSLKSLSTIGGMKVISFAKFSKFGADLYTEWVAPYLSKNLYTETWQNGVGKLTSNCSQTYFVKNIDKMSLLGNEYKESQDHSKWAVSDDGEVLCIGGINRMASQFKRGGGTLCFSNKSIAGALRDSIVGVEQCETSTMDASIIFDSFNKTCKLLELERAWFGEDHSDEIHSIWRREDCASNQHLFISKINKGKNDISSSKTTKPGIFTFNQNRSLRAHLYNENGQSHLEVWSKVNVVESFNLSNNNIHGLVYDNGPFASLSWSPNMKKFAYVSEALDLKPQTSSLNGVAKFQYDSSYDYNENWGLYLLDYSNSVVCILDRDTSLITTIPICESLFWAQPTFLNNSSLLLMGYDKLPFKYGLSMMPEKYCKLFSYEISSKTLKSLVGHRRDVLAYSLNKDNGSIACLVFNEGSRYRNYQSLIIIYPDSDVIHEIPNSTFCGPFLSGSLNGWLDNDHILITEQVGIRTLITKINLIYGYKDHIQLDSHPLEKEFSFKVLDLRRSNLLFRFQSIAPVNSTYCHGIGMVNVKNTNSLQLLTKPLVPNPTINVTISEYERDGRICNYILITPTTSTAFSKTLVVNIHGGPSHSSSHVFDKLTHNLVAVGFSVIYVNYTGSLNLDRDTNLDLFGRLGDIDVKDVHFIVNKIVLDHSYHKAVVYGRSYGGFLSAHLIGQYPDFYSAAVLKNPLIDIPTFNTTTDIPDQFWKLFNIPYDHQFPPVPTGDVLTTWNNASALRYVDAIRCPVLLLLGSRDVRVPPTQGLLFHRYLRSRGVKTWVKMFPDEHFLEGEVCFKRECFLSMVQAFTVE